MDKTREIEIAKTDRRMIQRLIRKTQSKDRKEVRDAATALIEEFVFASKKRRSIEPKLIEYFASCFETYLVNHDCDNDYWPDAMNTTGEAGHLLGIEKRNHKLRVSYAIHLNSQKSKESFMRQIVSSPPDYWTGKPPSRDTLIKLLPPKNSEIMKHYREVAQILLAPKGEQRE